MFVSSSTTRSDISTLSSICSVCQFPGRVSTSQILTVYHLTLRNHPLTSAVKIAYKRRSDPSTPSRSVGIPYDTNGIGLSALGTIPATSGPGGSALERYWLIAPRLTTLFLPPYRSREREITFCQSGVLSIDAKRESPPRLLSTDLRLIQLGNY